MRKPWICSLVVTCCLLVAICANAAPIPSLHEAADTDKDGQVTREELNKGLADRYRQEDADKDGRLTAAEYLQARQKNFDAADTNKDGIGVEEWVVYWCGKAGDAAKIKAPVQMDRQQSRFQRMDTNVDGRLHQNECIAFWAGRFVDLDANRDGKLSRDEYISRMKALVKTMDLDGDGVISLEEYRISWLGGDKAGKSTSKTDGK